MAVVLNNQQSWLMEVIDITPATIATISILILASIIMWYKLTVSTASANGAPPLPPGPRGLPIVGYIPFIGEELHKELNNMAGTYGPIFKFYLGSKLHVAINTIDLAKEVVRDQDETFANRVPSIASRVLTYGVQDIVFANNDSNWRNLRKTLVHEVLSNKNLEACHVYRSNEVRSTIKNIYGKLGTAIHINDVSFSTEANVVTSMICGSSLVRDQVSELQLLVSEVADVLDLPNVSDYFPLLAPFDLQGVELKAKMKLEKLERIITKLIDERNEINPKNSKGALEDEGKKDFLQILLDLKDRKNETSLNITQIKALLVDLIVAGTHTTTTLVEWTLAFLMQDENVMTRVREELEVVVGLNNIAEESHLPKLHYLDAVIKETFRLRPVSPLLLPRTPNKSCIVGGYTIPKGCSVIVNVWAIHTNPEYWDDPFVFNPERFLTNNMDYKGNNLRFLPFGAGRRLCPGIPLAEKMVMYILASLLHSFEWSLPAGEKHDLSEKFGLSLRKRNPLIAIPTQRLPNQSLYM